MDFANVTELPQPPRRTPGVVLWILFAVAVAGAALLLAAGLRDDVPRALGAAPSLASAAHGPPTLRPGGRSASASGPIAAGRRLF